MKIKAILIWNGNSNVKGGSYRIRFIDDDTIPSDWVTVSDGGTVQEKAVFLELPDGWKKVELCAPLNEYALAPAKGYGNFDKYSVWDADCEVKDGYIKAHYTSDDDRPTWSKIKIVEA